MVCSMEMLYGTIALNIIERLYNFTDILLMLFIIYKTTEIDSIRKSLQKVLGPLIVLEAALLFVTRFSDGMETALVFWGVLLVLFYVMWTVIHYAKQTSFKSSSASYQYIYYALLFEYGVSVITVIYSYIITDASSNEDNFMIFHISTVIAIVTASAGILTYQEDDRKTKVKKRSSHAEAEIRYL